MGWEARARAKSWRVWKWDTWGSVDSVTLKWNLNGRYILNNACMAVAIDQTEAPPTTIAAHNYTAHVKQQSSIIHLQTLISIHPTLYMARFIGLPSYENGNPFLFTLFYMSNSIFILFLRSLKLYIYLLPTVQKCRPYSTYHDVTCWMETPVRKSVLVFF